MLTRILKITALRWCVPFMLPLRSISLVVLLLLGANFSMAADASLEQLMNDLALAVKAGTGEAISWPSNPQGQSPRIYLYDGFYQKNNNIGLDQLASMISKYQSSFLYKTPEENDGIGPIWYGYHTFPWGSVSGPDLLSGYGSLTSYSDKLRLLQNAVSKFRKVCILASSYNDWTVETASSGRRSSLRQGSGPSGLRAPGTDSDIRAYTGEFFYMYGAYRLGESFQTTAWRASVPSGTQSGISWGYYVAGGGYDKLGDGDYNVKSGSYQDLWNGNIHIGARPLDFWNASAGLLRFKLSSSIGSLKVRGATLYLRATGDDLLGCPSVIPCDGLYHGISLQVQGSKVVSPTISSRFHQYLGTDLRWIVRLGEGWIVLDVGEMKSPSPPDACQSNLPLGIAGPAVAFKPTSALIRAIPAWNGYHTGGSITNLMTGGYTHFASDWKVGSPTGNCQACGGIGDRKSFKDSISLLRIYKPGFHSLPSTLGDSVFLSFDVSILASPVGGYIIHDPACYELLRYDADLQPLHADMPALKFVDAGGLTVTGPVNGGQAILTHVNGGRRVFECWSIGELNPFAGLVPIGRLIREEDRQGNAWMHAYSSDAAATHFTRAYSQDQFGNRISYVYSRSSTSGLLDQMVSAIVPDGVSRIAYEYTGSGLSKITYPNGECSRFQHPPSSGTFLCEEAAAEGIHRRKSVTLVETGSLVPDIVAQQNQLAVMSGVSFTSDSLIASVVLQSLSNGMGEGVLSRDESPTTTGFDVKVSDGPFISILHLDSDRFCMGSDIVTDQGSCFFQSNWGIGDRTVNIMDALGRSTMNIPDGHGLIVQEVRPDHGIVITKRSEGGDPLNVTDALGRTTNCTYDNFGNCLTQTHAFGTPLAATTSWTYNSRGQSTTMTDALGNVTAYDFDAQGHLVAERLPSIPGQPDAIKRFAYNAAGQLQTSTDPEGRTATYAYDLRGRHISTTYADGTTETTTYGSGQDANLVVARSNRNGTVTTYSYDAAGRQIAIVEGAGTSAAAVTTITYVPGTTLEATRTTDATVTTTTYDAYQRPSVTTVRPRSDLTLSTQTFYDAAGQMTRRLDPYGRNTYYVYDVNGREIRQVAELVPGGVVTPASVATLARQEVLNPAYTIQDQEWDAEGQLLARVDGRGVRTAFTYDALGRMTSQTRAVGTASAATTSWTYDLAGHRLTETSPSGVVTSWTYDARGQETSRTEGVGTPVEATTLVSYTPTGKVAAVTDALGRTTANAYGVCCDRLASTVDAAGYKTSFAYDAVGNRTSVTDPNNLTTSTAYDALNRPVTVTDAAGGKTSVTYLNRATNLPSSGVTLPGVTWSTLLTTLKLSGSARGSATVVTDPTGNKSVEVRDGLGRTVARVNALGQTTVLTYDAVVNGLVENTETSPTAAVTKARLDGAGLVREQVDALGALTTLTYDAAGNRRSVRNAVQVGQDWTYDLLGRRLTEADTAGSSTTTQYDADGRSLSVTNGMNEVTSFSYDARGRKATQKDPINGVTSFAYDDVSNLLSITDAQGGVTRYRYDALNRLVREDFPGATGGTRVYTYDAGGRLTGRSERLAATGGE